MFWARLRASLQNAKKKKITPILQAMPFTSFKEKKDMRQASCIDHEGPHESLGTKSRINAQSNHLTPLSSAIAPPVLKRRQNGKMGEERGIEK